MGNEGGEESHDDETTSVAATVSTAGRVRRGPLATSKTAAADRGTPGLSRVAHPGETVALPPVSRGMIDLLRLADRVAAADSSVLVQGETGTGKEWLARRVHASSRRSAGPFVAVHCAAIPEGLAEAALFGHEKGAFTGAVRSSRGHFEMAHGGTLFLDEIGEIPPSIQVKLLRVLQDRTFQPVGSEREVKVDVRVIAATNRDLEDAVAQELFRKDLYYRLAVITLDVPPLRQRVEDIPDLVTAYTRSIAKQLGRPAPTVPDSTMEALTRYGWPGNIRELINALERAVLLNSQDALALESLPPNLWANGATAPNQVLSRDTEPTGAAAQRSFAAAREEALAHFEVHYLSALLASVHGRVGDAAGRAGMSPRSLYAKMRRHGLRKEDFRD
jgi:DNA-binding NtrC family response regulator